MTYKKALIVGSLMPIFALTGCDNAEKKETEKTVVETPAVTPAPVAPKEVPATEIPSKTEMSHETVKTLETHTDSTERTEHNNKDMTVPDASMKKMSDSADVPEVSTEEPVNK